MNYEEICLKAKAEIIKVGAFIRESRLTLPNNAIEVKGKNDFVTTIDKESEKRLVSALESILPIAGFIAEEKTNTTKGEKYNWIIDPIDGTTNFIHGLFPHAISVALTEREDIVIGIVYEIGLNECFYTWKGGKAFCNSTEIHVSKALKISDSLIATGFPYYDYSLMKRFQKTLDYFMRNSHGIRRHGSAATDLAYVACGRFDAFYEYSLKPWDVAAGSFLIQQAGGKVADFNGLNNFIYGAEIMASNNSVFDEFSTIITKIMKK